MPIVLCLFVSVVLLTPSLAGVLLAGEVPAQLPPDIQADRYLVEAERHIKNRDYAAAKATLDQLLALDLALPEAFWFKHAQVALQAGVYADAVKSATCYLTTAGRKGAHYRAALELLDRAEAGPLPREGHNSIGMEFVLIEAGTFAMGSPQTESGRDDDEGSVYEVKISQPFYLGKYEVTQGQWAAVMGSYPSHFDDCGRNCPVERVSWEDAQAFIAALNRREGVSVYRLPTEAEWEYVARERGETGGCWYNGNSGDGTHPVGRKQPNGWGVYDMLGNVWEWTADRVYCGGSCRAASRMAAPPDRDIHIGFRHAADVSIEFVDTLTVIDLLGRFGRTAQTRPSSLQSQQTGN